MTYTKLFSLLFAFLLSMSAANAIGVLLLDGIQNGRSLSNDNVMLTFDERYTPETLIVVTIKKTDGSFVKEVTLVPSISRAATTFLNNGKYIINAYNVVTGKSESVFLAVR